MRKAHAALPTAIALVLAGGLAGAQNPPSKKEYKAQPLNLHRQGIGGESVDVGRTRMKNGDCDGALAAFDAALATSQDPTVHRDRGLCHDKLGHPYPAMDDYRFYLTASPDAKDADDIRERLAVLEDQTSGRPPKRNDDTDVPSAKADGEPAPTRKPAPVTGKEPLEYVEPDEDARRTPLRAGKGWSVAPFVSVRGWLGSSSPAGNESTWSECVGLQVRYATNRRGALVLEAGYEPFNLTDADAETVSGLSAQVAYELRFPLDDDYENQILLAPGLGYEHLYVSPTNVQQTPFFVGALVPRVRFGVRHLLTPAAGIDVSLDGGVANFFQYSSFPYDSNQSITTFVALNVGMVWGL